MLRLQHPWRLGSRATANMTTKAPKIGLSQARRLCQMSQSDRLDFIADGLPIVFTSAQGFWRAARQLEDSVREAEVLTRLAEEEAAKVLILMDMVRCPTRLVSSRIGSMVKWFYSHLARLIYSEAVTWKPMHVGQLREYVDDCRKSHHVDGAAGEYIMPNSTIFKREGVLYSDIAAYEDEGPSWSDPADLTRAYLFSRPPPPALSLAESMSKLGIFGRRGVRLTSQIWGKVDFKELESFSESNDLTQHLVKALINDRLTAEDAEQQDVDTLYGSWPLPMYHFDFSMVEVPLQELHNEQEALLWSEVSGVYY